MSTVFWILGTLCFSSLLSLWSFNMGHEDGYEEGWMDGKEDKN
jgi:hypothetical protein